MRTKRSHIEQLRTAIDCMPVRTRVAMLDGVRENEIIVGAYTDRNGGVCPMLAAHRNGGRTDFLGFARAWDRFTGASARSRRATGRELSILVAHLEDSLLAEHDVDLGAAIASHRTSLARSEARPRPGDPNREPELRRRPGWAWLRPFRRLDDYTRALDRLQAEAELLEVERTAERPAHEHQPA
jgi:hypothetical protein